MTRPGRRSTQARWLSGVGLATLALLGGLAAHAQTAPTLTLGLTSVTASGLTPSGSALWFGATRVGNGAFNQSSLVQKEVSADVTGWTELPLDGELPARSLWAVVDATSGAFAVAVPEGFDRLEEPFVASEVGRSSDGVADRLVAAHPWLFLLVVRPGVGAWSGTVADGRESDADGVKDGVVVAPLAALSPLAGSSPSPAALLAGDVVVWIDPRSLSFTAAPLTAATLEVQ